MALSNSEGMAALRAMFPSWDAPILAELLEANNGHLEDTIDMVLSMEPPAASSARAFEDDAQPAFASTSLYAAASPASSSSAYRKSPSSSPRRKSTASSSPSSRARVTLPDDFLRLPVDHTYDGHELSEQEQRDAILAEMLQNEIFRQELMQNEEFSAHFNGNRRSNSASSRRSSAAAYPEKSASEIASETFNAMSVKFASMSEAMKKKANEMYMRFQTRSDAPAEKDPYSHRPLMADDSSDEEDTNVRQRHKDRASSPTSSRSSMGGVVRRTNTYASKKNE
ncbi:hypothetical protein FI667_g14997, partial [Globisporangium splendens]